MGSISVEFGVWLCLIGSINVAFFLYTINYLLTANRMIADDAHIQSEGLSDSQKNMQRMRWIALVLIVMRLIFVLMVGLENGKLSYNTSLNCNESALKCTYMIAYYLVEEISAEGKIFYVIWIYQGVSGLLLRMYEIDTLNFHTDRSKHRRITYIKYGGYIAIACDITHRIINLTEWLLHHTLAAEQQGIIYLNIALYLISSVLFWIAFVTFVYNFYEIKSRALNAYHKLCHAMPDYKKIYFQCLINRLRYTAPLFLLWLIVYFLWSLVDILHHVLRVFNAYSNSTEYHIGLYWVYWVLSDTLLFIAILSYIKPQRSFSVLLKYQQPLQPQFN